MNILEGESVTKLCKTLQEDYELERGEIASKFMNYAIKLFEILGGKGLGEMEMKMEMGEMENKNKTNNYHNLIKV